MGGARTRAGREADLLPLFIRHRRGDDEEPGDQKRQGPRRQEARRRRRAARQELAAAQGLCASRMASISTRARRCSMARRRSSPKRRCKANSTRRSNSGISPPISKRRDLPAPSNSPTSKKALGAKGDVVVTGYVFDEGFAAKNKDALARFFAMTKKAKELIATSDKAWGAVIAQRIGAKDAKTLDIYRKRYVAGAPKRSVAQEEADAAHALSSAGRDRRRKACRPRQDARSRNLLQGRRGQAALIRLVSLAALLGLWQVARLLSDPRRLPGPTRLRGDLMTKRAPARCSPISRSRWRASSPPSRSP